MNDYIDIPKKLNQIESIVDKVWVKYGESDYETYRFKRNNGVLVSRGGFVDERKWELLAPNGLYIGKDGRGFMFRQAVVFGSLLLLQLESKHYEPVLLYDEVKIPDGDVVGYIKRLINQMNQQQELKTGKNETRHVPHPEKKINTFRTQQGMLIIRRDYYNVSLIEGEAFINDKHPTDGKYFTINDNVYKWFKIKKGFVVDFEQH